MREITTHKVKAAESLTVHALDTPAEGLASRAYAFTGLDADQNPTGLALLSNEAARALCSVEEGKCIAIIFQDGNPADGVNGLTNEVLLAVVADRLTSFQRGKFACAENATALTNINAALATLKGRTRERMARQVEGTMQP